MGCIRVTQGPNEGRTCNLSKENPFLIERQTFSDGALDHHISRKHARILYREGQWFIEDLGSANGTYLNDTRIQGESPLNNEDRIQAGATVILFKRGRLRPRPKPQQGPAQADDSTREQPAIQPEAESVTGSIDQSVNSPSAGREATPRTRHLNQLLIPAAVLLLLVAQAGLLHWHSRGILDALNESEDQTRQAVRNELGNQSAQPRDRNAELVQKLESLRQAIENDEPRLEPIQPRLKTLASNQQELMDDLKKALDQNRAASLERHQELVSRIDTRLDKQEPTVDPAQLARTQSAQRDLLKQILSRLQRQPSAHPAQAEQASAALKSTESNEAAPQSGKADPTEASSPPTTAEPTADQPGEDLVIVIDASGSTLGAFPLFLKKAKSTIAKLSEHDRFAVLFFQGDRIVEVPPRTLKQATREARGSAIAWMGFEDARIEPTGASKPYHALALALAYRPDRVLFISDDMVGGKPDPQWPQALDAMNGSGGVRIDTVQYFREDSAGLMQQLAEQHGGKYELIKESDAPAKPQELDPAVAELMTQLGIQPPTSANDEGEPTDGDAQTASEEQKEGGNQ